MLICLIMAYGTRWLTHESQTNISRSQKSFLFPHTYLREALQNPRMFSSVKDASTKKKPSKLPLFNVFGNQLPVWSKCVIVIQLQSCKFL